MRVRACVSAGERPGLACVLEGPWGLSELFTINKDYGYVFSQ